MENRDRRANILVLSIVVLSLLIIGVWLSYFVFYRPSASISASYIEVFQEVEQNNVTNLTIDCVDHKVVVLPSSDDKVKITYFQKQDNSITYATSGTSVSLKMVERSEDLDNLFYQSKRKIDTITIYVPESRDLNIKIISVDGAITVGDITVKSLSLTSVNGACKASYVTASRLNIVSNYGDITMTGCTSNEIGIGQVTGTTSVSLLESLNDYDVNIVSQYGTLTVNGQRLHETVEETDIIVNYLITDNDTKKTLNVSGIRNVIEVTSVEAPLEQENENKSSE